MHDKILISGCLLGQKVRYDGKGKAIQSDLLKQWQQEQRLISVCPEVIGGLPVPRAPAERQGQKVMTNDGDDVTQAFVSGAEQALALCKQHHIRFALLKESSPSCGSNTIYDGTFSDRKINGQGICSQLLQQHGIQVFSELTINQLVELLDK